MRKYDDLISKLTYDQKLSLIAAAGGWTSQRYQAAGLPVIYAETLKQASDNRKLSYPDSSALRNSWNKELVGDIAADIASTSKKDGVNLLFTPLSAVQSDPYHRGLSEDPYFAYAYLNAVTSAVKKAGVMPCVKVKVPDDGSVQYLDNVMNERVIYEHFMYPYRILENKSDIAGAFTYSTLKGSYGELNTHIVMNALRSYLKSGYVMCDKVEGDAIVPAIASGNMLSFESDVSPLRDAYNEYVRLKKDIDSGAAMSEELDSAVDANAAISEETIDDAVERIIDFAYAINSMPVTGDPVKPSLTVACEESVVLLKNEGALPISGKNKKIALVGGAQSQSLLDDLYKYIQDDPKFTLVGSSAGYGEGASESEACALADEADYVILILGTDKATEKKMADERRSKLPADQLALTNAISSHKAKVIVVLTSSVPVDMAFDASVSAVLLSPCSSSECALALENIISGRTCPSGKLACTYYDGTDELYAKIRGGKNSGKHKVGLFMGYRNYELTGIAPKYAFGHGLSYSSFKYSSLSVAPGSVSLKVKNCGKYIASEVVQLYIGKEDSSVLRPFKELKSFVKIKLNPGESKKIRFDISENMLAVYDVNSHSYVTEGGKYEVYIGSASNDIRLTGKITVQGVELAPDGENISEYLSSQANVLDGGYTLEPIKSVENKGSGAKKAGIAFIVIALLCALSAIVLKIVEINGLPQWLSTYMFIGSAALFLLGLLLAVVGAAKHKRAQAEAEISKLADPTQAGVSEQKPYELLFEEEYESFEEETVTKNESGIDEEAEALNYYDKTIGMQTICERFTEYAAERGYGVSLSAARKLISAMCASRLVCVKTASRNLIRGFINVLSEYFGGKSYYDIYTDYASVSDFVLKHDGSDTQATVAINEAAKRRAGAHIAILDGVNPMTAGAFFLPFSRYVKSPQLPAKVAVKRSGESDKILRLTPNVWFVFLLDPSVPLVEVDQTFADMACFIDIDVAEKAPAPMPQGKATNYYQLVKTCDSCTNTQLLDEVTGWKNIDKLEKFVSEKTPYKINNKKWISMEKFSACYLAAGGEHSAALDNTVASLFILIASKLVSGKINQGEDGLIATAENIFGEDSIPECRKMLSLPRAGV